MFSLTKKTLGVTFISFFVFMAVTFFYNTLLSPTVAEAKVGVLKVLPPVIPKIKILIVAGHEPNFGGAIYKKIKERDLDLALSKKLKKILEKNPRYEIIVSRDSDGWNPQLEYYIKTKEDIILSWVKDKKATMLTSVASGNNTIVDSKMGHMTAGTSSALYLFGINKWANENKFDMEIHLHFNDNLRYKGKPNYEGFAIYVPEKQYGNSTSSKILADYLMPEMLKIQKISTMEEESAGIIEDQELIALGRYNTSNITSVLVEYAYMNEKFIQKTKTRNAYLDKAAASTARAINNFFK